MLGGPIRASELDPSFKREVMTHEAARDITACFSCGTCTAGCPIHAVYPEHDPRKIARMVNLGMRKRALSSPYIWYCSDCGICEECMADAIYMKEVNDKNIPFLKYPDECWHCGSCRQDCPVSAIEILSFLNTCKSSPSSPKYCTKLYVKES